MKIRLLVPLSVALSQHQALVHEAEIPPFQTEPEVIVWGDRVFKRSGQDQLANDPPVTEYTEVFAYALVS
jgi:hypothetical protein